MITIYDNCSQDEFLKKYNESGFIVVKGNFNETLLNRFKEAMLACIEIERELIHQPDTNYRDYGFLLCAPYYLDKYPFLLEIFEHEPYLQYVEWILEKWFILHLYSCNCLPPDNGNNKAREIHIDTPRVMPPLYHTFVATMINLDDYNDQNGATWILPKSHENVEKPSEDYFYKNAVQLIIPKGSICFFNPRIWHATGTNYTSDWRSCLLIAFCKPWMKQRVDIPKFIQHIDKKTISPKMQQLLGYHCQAPTSFDQFYGPQEIRTYTQPFV